MFALMALLALFLIVLPALSAPLALRALHADNSACFAFAASIAVCLLLAFLCLLLCASPGCSACSAWFALSALLALPYYARMCLQSLHAGFACSVPGRLTVPVLACSANLPPATALLLCAFAALGLYFSLNHPSVMFAWLAMSACPRARTSSIACFACSARSVGLCRIRGLPRKRTECAPHVEEFRVGLLATRRPKNNEV